MNEKPNNQNIANALRGSLGSKHVLVVGDLMLDRYVSGTVDRLSQEAPVSVLHAERETSRAGGAGNVALNLSGLGLQVSVAGFIGDDARGKELLAIFELQDIDTSAVIVLSDRPTITKTRVMAGHQHILRIDEEDLSEINGPHWELTNAIYRRLQVDAIILSDYAKGVLSDNFCEQMIEMANQFEVPVLVDPKGQDFSKYEGATVLTPNHAEITSAVVAGIPVESGESLVKELGLQFLVVTLGADGMVYIDSSGTVRSPAKAQEVFDVSGAGDTVIATITAAMLAGLDNADMLHMTNLAAGVVVGHVGATAIRKRALIRALHAEEQAHAESVYSLVELDQLVSDWRKQGECIVFTNGCFDIVHAGHVTFLHKAKRQGDRLIVGINTDNSVRSLKGAARPINGEDDRACIIAALASVDAVILFDDDTPLQLIEALRPDVLVKGSDYSEDQVAGASQVEAHGGRVVLVPLVAGKSSSDIISKIASWSSLLAGPTADRLV